MDAAPHSPTAEAPRPPRAASAPPAVVARRRRSWPWAATVLLLIATLVIRLGYVHATPGYQLVDDAKDYDGHALSIANGHGFSDELAYHRPTAFRPPAYPYLLGAVYRLAGLQGAAKPRRVHAARIAQAAIGTVAVGLMGLLAAQLWGPGVALVAIALAAVYVPLITMSGAVMSEPLSVAFMLGSLIAALRHRRSARRYRWALLAGLLGGLAILTRANNLILLLPLALAVWDRRPRWSWRALGPPVALLVVATLAVTPWTIRNAVKLHAFVPVSTQLGSALAGTYNDASRTDPEHPASWRHLRNVPDYADLWRTVARSNEAVLERKLRHRAIRYAEDHPLYVAQVAFWTTVRGLDLDGLDWSRHTASTVGVDASWADAGVYCFWAFALLALAGAFTPLARRAPGLVWAVPALMYLSVVFLVIETPRYRTPLDPFIVLLAALALVTAGRRLGPRRSGRPARAGA